MTEALDALKLRQRKTIERKIAAREITYSHTKKAFVYLDDEDKEFDVACCDHDHDSGSDEDDLSEEEKKEEEKENFESDKSEEGKKESQDEQN